jgi:hypothetical protein
VRQRRGRRRERLGGLRRGVGHDHDLVVETHADVKFDAGGGLLQVELVFHWGQQHTLGRLRLSATGDARPFSVAGAGVDPWSAMQEKINVAIDRGVDWLVENQQIDGSWNHEQWTLPLRRNRARHLHPAQERRGAAPPGRRARARVHTRGTPSKETYTIGCQLLALGALDDPAYEPWIKELAETLLTFQRGGLFNYPWGGPTSPTRSTASSACAPRRSTASRCRPTSGRRRRRR